MSVLLVTRSDDNESVTMVAEALRERGEAPIRLDTDRYPEHVRWSTWIDDQTGVRRTLETAEGTFDLDRVTAVWYRRFFAGGRLPQSLGDMRTPCVNESRRTLYGGIAALDAFQLDPLIAVRRTDHKELQLQRARELGLHVPRTLITNSPAAARRFVAEAAGPVVTKMQSSFALYRGGQELVVFTTPVSADDLVEADGLCFAPMTFQEEIPKRLDVRVTVVGTQTFGAALDSQRADKTRTDWRRDGVSSIASWQPFALDPESERALLALTRDFGLNYAAADFVLTPEGRLVFLEINAGGEWFWLQHVPGLPIAGALADVLSGRAARVPTLDAGAARGSD